MEENQTLPFSYCHSKGGSHCELCDLCHPLEASSLTVNRIDVLNSVSCLMAILRHTAGLQYLKDTPKLKHTNLALWALV